MIAALNVRRLIAPFALAAVTVAQVGWVQVATTGPAGRFGHGMAYDGSHHQTVLFGGTPDGATYLGDTWTWSGVAWQQANVTGPAARTDAMMAYDSARQHVVMFGGSSANGPLGDTWEWNGATWLAATPAVAPSPRVLSGFAFDSGRGVSVLFGGSMPSVGADTSETWEWDGSNWVLAAAVGPSARYGCGMTHDSRRHRTVMFGGRPYSGSPAFFGDTWEWDGVAWTAASVGGPSARGVPGFAFDAPRGKTVLFGGTAGTNGESDTWEWDGASWTQVQAPGMPWRVAPAMVYMDDRHQALMFGGFGPSGSTNYASDTWTYTGAVSAELTQFGQGCPSPAGIPQLAAAAGSLPIIGQTLHLQVTNLPTSIFSVPFAAIGFSDQLYGSTPLPVLLDFLGATGCTLYISIDEQFTLTNAGGTANWDVPVPLDVTILGLHGYLQAACFTSGVNTAGFVVANALHAVVGT